MNPFYQAWALLKAPVMPGRAGFPEDDPDYLHPGHISEIGMEGDSSLIDEARKRENAYREAYIDGKYDPGEFGPWWQGPPKTTETLGTEEEDALFTRNNMVPVDTAATVRRLSGSELPIRVQQASIQDDEGPSFFGMPFNEKSHFTRSEPMELAFQLLKGVELYDEDESDPDDPSRLRYHLDPDEQMWHDEADADLRERTNDLMGYLQNMSPEEKLEVTRAQGNPLLSGVLEGELGACKDGVCGHDEEDELHQNNIRQADQFLLESMMESWMPDAADHGLSGIEFQDMDREAFPQGQSKDWTAEEGFRAHAVNPLHWRKLAGEPIDIALQLLKAADSVGFGETPDYQLLPGQMTLDQFPYEGMVDDITHIRSVDPKWFNTMALSGASPLQQARDNQIFEERLPQMESRKLDQIYDRFFFDEPGRQRYMRDKHVPYKQLDTSTPATWWTKPSVENIGRSYIGSPLRMEDRMLVGVKGDLDGMRTQQRDAIQAPESLPEKMVHDTIPPEKLVFIEPSAEDMVLPHGMEKYSPAAKAKQMLRNLAGRHGFPKGMTAREMGKDEGGIARFDKDPLASW